jgi:SAM-dependent methyltransferase
MRSLVRRLLAQQQLRSEIARERCDPRACPACGCDRATELLRGDRDFIDLQTQQCVACGFVFTTPFYSDRSIKTFYEHQYRSLFKGEPDPRRYADRTVMLRARAAYYAALFVRARLLTNTTKAFLDLGCGEGSLLAHLKSIRPDLRLCGVEPGASYRRFVSEQLDIPVYADVADVPGEFDAISTIHVLEHVRDPATFLAGARQCLTAVGKLFVDVPDVLRYRNLEDIHLGHCNHFTRTSIVRVLRSAGLMPGHAESHEPPTLPSSVFAIATHAERVDIEPVSYDPLGDDAAEAIRKINPRLRSYVLMRVKRKLGYGKDS